MTIPGSEQFDESKQEFIIVKEQTVCLEHSLISISKWESKWQKPFLTNQEKTNEETLDYIRCMSLDGNANSEMLQFLTEENIQIVNEYIASPMSATVINEQHKGKNNGEQITSELIYYWMVALTIPFECQKWHLNRLLTLIRICNIKNQPPKKRSRSELLNRNAALNAARRGKMGTHG